MLLRTENARCCPIVWYEAVMTHSFKLCAARGIAHSPPYPFPNIFNPKYKYSHSSPGPLNTSETATHHPHPNTVGSAKQDRQCRTACPPNIDQRSLRISLPSYTPGSSSD